MPHNMCINRHCDAGAGTSVAVLLFPNVGTICRLPSMKALMSASVTLALL